MKKTALLMFILLSALFAASGSITFTESSIPVNFKASYGSSRTIQFFNTTDQNGNPSFSLNGLLKEESIEEPIGYIQIESAGSAGFKPRLTVTASYFHKKVSDTYYVLPAKYLIDCSSLYNEEAKTHVGVIDLSDSPTQEKKSLVIEDSPQLASPATYTIPISVRVDRTNVMDSTTHNTTAVPKGSYISNVTVTYWEVQ